MPEFLRLPQGKDFAVSSLDSVDERIGNGALTKAKSKPTREGWPLSDPRHKRARDTRVRIMEAAEEMFLSAGFLGTSMDQIAERAEVSKMTLYRHFTDKNALFVETIHHQCTNIIAPLPNIPASSKAQARQLLRRFGESVLKSVASPEVISLFRIMVGETSRFPELTKIFYDEGPGKALEMVETILSGVMPRDLAHIRANAFMHIMLGDTYQRLILGTLASEDSARHFAPQINTAIELVLAGV